jgi:hypothetical protein
MGGGATLRLIKGGAKSNPGGVRYARRSASCSAARRRRWCVGPLASGSWPLSESMPRRKPIPFATRVQPKGPNAITSVFRFPTLPMT